MYHIKKMTSNQGPKFDLRNAQFAGGFAETVEGDQIGGLINNHSNQANDLENLFASLRQLTQSFPQKHQEEALLELQALEDDVKGTDAKPQQLGLRLKRLMMIATMATAVASGAATFSQDVKNFTNNIFEVANTLDIPFQMIKAEPKPPDNAY